MSRACGRQGGPEGPWRDEKSHGSIPHGRDHGGGDHPAPFRTRQLSPPSPRVLRREAAGGQDVAPMEDAFLLRGPGGAVAPGALFPFPLVSNVFILCGVQTGLFRTGILSNNTYILVFPCQRGIIRE